MSFWQQLHDAVRAQIEDFFRVKWQAVALLIFIVAAIVDLAFLRWNYGPLWWERAPLRSLHLALCVGTVLAIGNFKRFLK